MILVFLEVLEQCYRETTFADDRPLYAIDIVTVTRWILMLHKGEAVEDVIQSIKSPATSKHFTDYWKKGRWGSAEASALELLQTNLTKG